MLRARLPGIVAASALLAALDDPVVPLVIGLVRGTMTETSFHQGPTIAGGDVMAMLTRPGTAGLLGAAVLILGWTLLSDLRQRRR